MARRRKRYSDIVHVKPTNGQKVVTHDWRRRHEKRKSDANNMCRNAGLAFASLGGWLNIKNDGHHWQVWFPKGNVRLVEWWPASAKLVVNQTWKQGIHVHRWQDVFRVVREMRKVST